MKALLFYHIYSSFYNSTFTHSLKCNFGALCLKCYNKVGTKEWYKFKCTHIVALVFKCMTSYDGIQRLNDVKFTILMLKLRPTLSSLKVQKKNTLDVFAAITCSTWWKPSFYRAEDKQNKTHVSFQDVQLE